MIRIDIVTPFGGSIGGVEKVVGIWANCLDKKIFKLRVVALGPSNRYFDSSIEAYSIKSEPKEGYTVSYLKEAYSQMIDQIGYPDICIATIFPVMVEVCCLVRDEKKLDMKVLSWIHNDMSFYSKENGSGTLENILMADGHLCLHDKKSIEIKRVKKSAKTYIIGNPITDMASDMYNPRAFKLAFIGRFAIVKGIDIILEAMYKSRFQWELKIIGDGQLHDEVLSWINLLHLDKCVELTGWVEEPFEYCNDTGILVMASETEGMPLTAYEALSRGMTVITTPVGSLEMDIENGRNGYVFNVGNVDELVSILDDIGSGKKKLLDKEVCRNSVKRFFVDEYFERLQKVLLEVYDN